MRRRDFLTLLGGGAASWPVTARAQRGEQVRRVGVLTYGNETGVGALPLRRLLGDDLKQLGWIEGRNLRLDFRFGSGDAAQTRVFAADLVQLAPDVIVTVFGTAVRTMQQQTTTIPIVFIGNGDPIENGTVSNPAHPQGNLTGFANGFGSLGGKYLGLLKEVAPNVTRVAFMHPAGYAGSYLLSVETAARSLGMQIIEIPVSDADGMRAAIATFAAEPNGGLFPSPGIAVPLPELTRLAAQHRLPAIYGVPLAPAAGGLMSYNADTVELVRGAASYVDRLLRGAKVSDLPVQYPTKFRLVINLKTAKALGLIVPPNLLALADEVIE
jgi:putative ABC transport system substrate-binding protein